MKAVLTLILALAAAQALSAVPNLSIANKIGYAYPGTATIDGIISEGEWDAATGHDGNLIIEFTPANWLTPPTDDADLSGVWYALWDEEALYIYLEVNDDDLIIGEWNSHPIDDFQVFLSSAYSRKFGEYPSFEGYDHVSDFHFVAHLLLSGEVYVRPGNASFSGNSPITKILTVYSMTDSGYRVEMKLPWSYVMGDTSASKVTFENGVFKGGVNSENYGAERNFIGFDLLLRDQSTDNNYTSQVAWNSGYEGRRGGHHFADTSVWGTLVLVPIDTWNMKDALFSAEPWIDMGNDFVFNLVEEHFYYIGFNRYAYDFADESWWYIHEDGAKPDGFFIYDFTQGQWFYMNEGLKMALD